MAVKEVGMLVEGVTRFFFSTAKVESNTSLEPVHTDGGTDGVNWGKKYLIDRYFNGIGFL